MPIIYRLIIFYLLSICSIASAQYITQAKQAILIDGNTGQILYEYNSNERMPPSSMTKIMTTYIIFDSLKEKKISINDRFNTSEKAWKMQGSRMFLNLNDTPTIDEILKGIIVQSGNDACIVAAEGLFGNEDNFVNAMNNTAKKLNMINTNFVNSSGWPNINHFSTAQDLSKLSIALINNFPEYYHYHQITNFTYGKISQYNRNPLLNKLGVDGIKTGHTDAGGYGMVISALKNNIRLIAVINGLTSEKARAQEGENLIHYGMFNFKLANLFKNDDIIAKTMVVYGELPEINLTVKNDINILIDDNNSITCNVFYQEEILAPIIKGQKFGTIQCKVANIYNSYLEFDLVALNTVKESNFIQKIWQNIVYILSS